jgi:hypothetical protein
MSKWCSLYLFKIWGLLRYQGDASFWALLKSRQEMLECLELNRLILCVLILISIENYSNSDTLSESEYESDQGSALGSGCDEDEPTENLEPELSATIHDHDYDAYYSPLTVEAQLQAQHNATLLAQLHADIKGRAQLPDPTYQKLLQSWPTRPFDVRILPDYIKHPIYYFELFWGPEVWNTLVENTNTYTLYKEARYKTNKTEKKSR